MSGEDTQPKHKSLESVTDANVQHLLNIALAGASVVEGLTPRTQNGTTTLYSEYRTHHDKPFQKYAELSMVSPHIFIPLAKLSLSMVSGFKLEAEGNKSLQQEMDGWAYRIGLKNKYQSIARCLVRDAQPQSNYQQKRMAALSKYRLKGTSIARSRSVLRIRNWPTFSLPGFQRWRETAGSWRYNRWAVAAG